MKVKIAALQEGVNKLHLKTTVSDLGFDENEEQSFLFPATINADVEVQKLTDRYFVKVNLSTLAHFTCDRCLEEFDQNLTNSFQLYYVKQVERTTESDDYKILKENAEEIDLTENVMENLILAIPMKHICKQDCAGLCPDCGTNLNIKKCLCRQERIDPRWEKLKSLK